MKNKIWLVLLMIFVSKNIYSKTLSEYLSCKSKMYLFMNTSAEQIFFTDEEKKVEFEILTDKNNKEYLQEEYTYDIREENDSVYLYVSNQVEENKYLMLVSDFYLILYASSDSKPFFIGELQDDTVPTESLCTDSVKNISASSFLVEKDVSYSPDNVANFNLDSPWVEGASGKGIGESITLNCPKSRGILIGIGYVSWKKPYLYKKNSRPKKIRITLVDTGKSCLFDLKDTPNPQIVVYPENTQYSGEVKVEIVDVYNGTDWNDTCINFIKPLFFIP